MASAISAIPPGAGVAAPVRVVIGETYDRHTGQIMPDVTAFDGTHREDCWVESVVWLAPKPAYPTRHHVIERFPATPRHELMGSEVWNGLHLEVHGYGTPEQTISLVGTPVAEWPAGQLQIVTRSQTSRRPSQDIRDLIWQAELTPAPSDPDEDDED